jgi:hypothetical protein
VDVNNMPAESGASTVGSMLAVRVVASERISLVSTFRVDSRSHFSACGNTKIIVLGSSPSVLPAHEGTHVCTCRSLSTLTVIFNEICRCFKVNS